jgi:3-deoxy-D-manno-octulosonate 8-phosphate phosphatase (KDO 8-P phosphatase)
LASLYPEPRTRDPEPDVVPGPKGFPSQAVLRKLKLVLFDVDGVLSDGRIVLNDDGEQTKFFHVRDGAGITLLQNGGLMAGVVTGRMSNVVNVRAKELKIPPERVRQGAVVKAPAVKQLLSELNVAADETGYVGDDLIDMPVLELVGVACCPADAYREVLAACHVVSKKKGGRGAVRSICEFLLKARDDGSWERAVDIYLGRA